MARRWRRLSRTRKAARTGAAALRRRARGVGATSAQALQHAARARQRLRAARQRPHLLAPIARRTRRGSTPRARPAPRWRPPARAARPRSPGAARRCRPWRRSLRSSMMLMPPTKATSRSTTHSLWCRRRSWPGCSRLHQRSSGRNTASCDAGMRQPVAADAASVAFEPKPSTTTRTRTPRRAGARQRVGHGARRPRRRGRCRSRARPRGARARWPRAWPGTARRRPAAGAPGCRP